MGETVGISPEQHAMTGESAREAVESGACAKRLKFGRSIGEARCSTKDHDCSQGVVAPEEHRVNLATTFIQQTSRSVRITAILSLEERKCSSLSKPSSSSSSVA